MCNVLTTTIIGHTGACASSSQPLEGATCCEGSQPGAACLLSPHPSCATVCNRALEQQFCQQKHSPPPPILSRLGFVMECWRTKSTPPISGGAQYYHGLAPCLTEPQLRRESHPRTTSVGGLSLSSRFLLFFPRSRSPLTCQNHVCRYPCRVRLHGLRNT